MGGQAFATFTTKNGDPVRVPRMPPHIYKEVLRECKVKLEQFFERVLVPREVPGKSDHGDIDFLVDGIRTPVAQSDLWATVQETLGADLYLARGGSHSFAILHPTEPNAHVQVDVELSPGNGTDSSAELLAWTYFMKGYSDLVQILGIAHRPLGLTCNDQGLHIRVEEIEPYNKKKALLFLSRDPNKVMKFYGLDADKYWTGFMDEEDIFKWAISGRFFSLEVFDSRVPTSNDKSRLIKRPMYRRFVEEFMLGLPNKRMTSRVWTRAEMLEEALRIFDKQTEYDMMIAEHHQKEAEEHLWKEVKGVLPVSGNSLALALKSLRRWVIFDEGRPRLAPQPILDERVGWAISMAATSRPELLEWVKQHWKEAKVLEKARAATMKEVARSS